MPDAKKIAIVVAAIIAAQLVDRYLGVSRLLNVA